MYAVCFENRLVLFGFLDPIGILPVLGSPFNWKFNDAKWFFDWQVIRTDTHTYTHEWVRLKWNEIGEKSQNWWTWKMEMTERYCWLEAEQSWYCGPFCLHSLAACFRQRRICWSVFIWNIFCAIKFRWTHKITTKLWVVKLSLN